jgi:hypothetical protein
MLGLSSASFASYGSAHASSSILVQPATVSSLWADHGSGSAHDVTVFTTTVPSGYSAVADYAQVGYEAAGTFTNWQRPYGPPVALKEAGEGASLLAKPLGWTKLYTASASAAFTLWRATAPAGFVAIGDVGTTDGNPPSSDAPCAVVAEQCVARCDADALLWADADNGIAFYGAHGNATHLSTGGLFADLAFTAPVGERGATPPAYCLLAKCVGDASKTPEQLHIALGTSPDRMGVQWATDAGATSQDKLCTSQGAVLYGTSAAKLEQRAVAECSRFVIPGGSQLMQSNYNATSAPPPTASAGLSAAHTACALWHAAENQRTRLAAQNPRTWPVVRDLQCQAALEPRA